MYSSTAPQFIHQNGLVRLDAARQEDVADHPQRRHVLPALGRSGLRARATGSNCPGLDRSPVSYMGPDGYTWGRDFVSAASGARRVGSSSRRSGTGSCCGAGSPTSRRSRTRASSGSSRRAFPAAGRAGAFDAAGRRSSKILPLVTASTGATSTSCGIRRRPGVRPGSSAVRDFITPKLPADARRRGRRAAARSCR